MQVRQRHCHSQLPNLTKEHSRSCLQQIDGQNPCNRRFLELWNPSRSEPTCRKRLNGDSSASLSLMLRGGPPRLQLVTICPHNPQTYNPPRTTSLPIYCALLYQFPILWLALACSRLSYLFSRPSVHAGARYMANRCRKAACCFVVVAKPI